MPRLAALPVLLALALIPVGACGQGGASSTSAAPSAEPLTPVPAPAGLVADLFVPAPAATWTKLRVGVGGPAVFMPQSFGGAAATLLGLPITMAAEIDEAVPLVGAALRQGKGPLLLTVGVHVKSGERFLNQLTRGEGARFNAVVDPMSRVTLLTDKVSPESARFALGVVGNYLLVGPKAADLHALGPYVARTLPTKGMPKEEVAIEIAEAALGGPILEAARDLRAQGEGATAALIPVGTMLEGLIGLLGDAKQARVTMSFDERVMHARATITPRAGGGAGSKLIAELPVGDARPLLDLPESTTLGVLWRESATARGESAPKQAEALAKLLGQDVSADDRGAISAALKAEAEARGDWQAVGIAFNGTGPTAVVRAPVSDADRMKKALKQLVDLAALPTLKASLAKLGLALTVDKAVVENLAGDVTRVRLARVDRERTKDEKGKKGEDKQKGDAKAKKAPEPPPPDLPKAIDLLYLVNGEGLFASAGFDPRDSLRTLAKTPAGSNLGSIAPMSALLSGIEGASFVLVADALRINAATSGLNAPPTPAPVLIAAGRTASPAELWGRADLPFVVVTQLVTEYARRRPAPAQ